MTPRCGRNENKKTLEKVPNNRRIGCVQKKEEE